MPSVRMQIRVQPRASANEIAGFDEQNRLRVRVTSAPADGAANAAVIALLSDTFDVPKSAVTIERGHSSRTKTVLIDGVGADAVRAVVAAG